jgi:hypothetical protein
MNYQNLIEMVQEHHPNMGLKEIQLLLKRAYDEFCDRTELLDSSYYAPSTAGRRHYHLDKDVIRVKHVQIEGHRIPRKVGKQDNVEEDVT